MILTREITWTAKGNFIETDWTDLQDGPEKFIRVIGSASASQAADVISAIAKFRQTSTAFVITNAVKIDGIENADTIHEMTLERLASVNVLEELLTLLTPEECAAVKALLETKE